ncbi:class IV lanthionine synthetase LanL [Kitasatospora sp. NPDC054939]
MGSNTSLRTAGGRDSDGHGPHAGGSWPERTRAALAGAGSREGGGTWAVDVDGFWCTVGPPADRSAATPAQGWKIHVSAASAAAEEVLAAVTRVIAADPCPFKFAAAPQQLHELNSRNSERGSAGKFVTVYPDGDTQFRRLAAALHEATAGLPGPVVLSDRPYAPGSRVHYRYGAFAGRAELGNDGGYRSMLHGPDGERVEDVRGAAYRCPPWVRDPWGAGGGRSGVGPSGVAGGVGGSAGSGAAGGVGVPGARGAAQGRPGAGKPVVPARRSGGVLLVGRYAITSAVRHGTKGGVFLGRDVLDGTEVVVKQARAHIEVDRAGTDARTALRHEAALLGRLAELARPGGPPVAPNALELIEQDDSLFLVQERIAGRPLGTWVADRLRRDGSPDVDWSEAGPLARALVDLLERIHTHGLVLRDLSPGNVLVLPGGGLRLVDLELAAETGSRAGSAGTPGYRAPEQGPGGRLSLVTDGTCRADPAADLYALGGLLFLLATGHDPLLPEDLPHARPVADRLGRWLALAARHGATARRLAPLVLGLRAAEPAERWSLERVRAGLADGRPDGPAAGPPPRPRPRVSGVDCGALVDSPASGPSSSGPQSSGPHSAEPSSPGPLDLCDPVPRAAAGAGALVFAPGTALFDPGAPTGPDLERVLHDGLHHLAATATPERRDRLWPAVPAGRLSDPCNVQHGAAGVLALLARVALQWGMPTGIRDLARRTARTAADWIEPRCTAEPSVLPGLHFGRSGTAWALLDAATALEDRELSARAVAMARSIPSDWPNPDVCHGTAGAGLAQLRFGWGDLASPVDREFRARAVHSGHALLAAAQHEPYGTVWPVPKDFDSALAGITHLGYAHGVAGVGAFLLAAAEESHDRVLLAGAAEAGRTLAATVRRAGPADPAESSDGGTTARWPQSAGDPGHVRLTHWCSGSSGVGTFLLRLWQNTGDHETYELALAAGQAVLADRWHSGTSACHGLAGDGEYLLDLAEATGDRAFHTGAVELAHLIAARAAVRDGLLVLPDETGTDSAAAYGTGTAGALAFLLRLLHGGPRLWVDPVPPGLKRQAPHPRPETGAP